MAVTCVLSNHYKYQKDKGEIDLSADTIKVLLMRTGFVFDKDIHATRKNLKGTITRTDISFVVSGKHILSTAGDFVAAGFVPGGKITVSGSASNDGTLTLVTVAAGDITVSEAVVSEGEGASITITGADELATGNGYTQDTKVLTNQVLTEDDTNDRSELTCDDVDWTAGGGSIGPTPGAMLIDDSTSDDTIIGFINFGAEQTAIDGTHLTITNIKLRNS